MEKIKVNMSPNPLDVQTIHASQNDGEAREWEFELHNNGEKIDSSSISDQLVFKAYKGGTEQLLPENTSTPTTSPFKGDIKYSQGLLTDQEFTYRQSPTEEDGLAKITDIKGNTLVWNQLINTVVSKTADGITTSFDSSTGLFSIKNDSRTTNFSSGSNSNTLVAHANCVVGHKYLINADKNIQGITIHTDSQQGYIPTILNYSGTGGFYIRLTSAYDFVSAHPVGDVTSFHIYIVDLTQMFGSGNEPSSISDFTSLFPLSYYSYNQGSLLSFNGNGIKTVGFNQWDEEWESGRINSDGTKVASSTYIRSKNYIRIFPNTTYYRKAPNNIQPFYYDGNMNFISYGLWGANSTFSTPNNAEYMLFHIDPAYGTTYKNDVCINISDPSKNGTYEPYTSSTLSLPISTYFPNGMKSAGNVYDELTENKAITKIGMVDLGSLTWYYSGGLFLAQISNGAYTGRSVGSANEKCVLYEAEAVNPVSLADKQMTLGTAYAFANVGNIVIKDTSYSSSSAFKTAMNGVMLYYELATPTETSFTTASLVTENGEVALANENGVLVGRCNSDVSADAGFIEGKIKLSDSDGDVYSNKIQIHVERSPQ